MQRGNLIMSIQVICRECDAAYDVADEMAGKTIRCRKCDAQVRVPDEDDASPRRRSRKPAAKSNKTTMILLIVGGVLGLGCIVCSGVGVVGYFAVVRVAKGVEDFKQDLERDLNGVMVAPGNGKVILSKEAVLMPNDPLRDGRPTKSIPITLQQGKTYVIDMQSAEMDSYLFLFDPNNIKVAEDDDGGGFPHARIRFTANRTGAHTIGCTAFGGARPGGSRFNVTVREE
jgi:hypothetical protein